ncbi:MAG: 50S ribosomal protein L4, partial [Parcubacteria group bacterium]|nr:50S ribosomal protein L4 [Parcubacteria group bacterium]
MKTMPIYNMQGETVGNFELNPKVFEATINPELIYQAVSAQSSNKRIVSAHTKTRGEVRGGGRKPWKQKHTGRARQGSVRSPLWIGGGIVFGPRNERNYSKNLNKK